MRRDTVFFVDRSLGSKIVPEALRKAGYSVVLHDDEFQPSTKDEEWLGSIGRSGYAFISKDEAIARRPNEILAIMRAKVHGFLLYNKNNSSGQANAASILRAMPQIIEICKRHQPPSLHRIYHDGRLGEFENYDDLYRKYHELEEKRKSIRDEHGSETLTLPPSS